MVRIFPLGPLPATSAVRAELRVHRSIHVKLKANSGIGEIRNLVLDVTTLNGVSWDNVEGLPGQESFLDIVANIVGILIILGIVVGIRAQRFPVESGQVDAGMRSLETAVEQKRRSLSRVYQDLRNLQLNVRALEAERRRQEGRRDRIALEVAALEKLVGERLRQSAEMAEEAVQLQLQVQEKLNLLRELEAQKTQSQALSAQITEILHYPAPVARFVDGRELHFQIANGRIAFIPLDRLVERLKSRSKAEGSRLVNQLEWTDTVGPEGGFQMRYVLRRYDVPINLPGGGRATASYARVEHWVLLPVSPQLGEPVEESLKEGSEFWRIVRAHSPQMYTVTIWVYPESFEAYRRIRSALHAAGYSCAARPLPAGVPISGSPRGSRSAVQ